jgi:hypothetical protein
MSKRYIGDGVYVDFDGYGIVLTTENGISETNRIVLEPEVYGLLLEYVKALKVRVAKERDDEHDGDENRA